MKRFIITGAPGAGKTAIVRQPELDGFGVVEEAAAGVIAEAHAQGRVEVWRDPSFIDAIAHLQKDRLIRASRQPDEVQFHDRCVVCTAALAVYPGYRFLLFSPASWSASAKKRSVKTAFSSFATLDSLHLRRRGASALRMRFVLREFEQTYRDFGFELFRVEPGSPAERAGVIKAAVRQLEADQITP